MQHINTFQISCKRKDLIKTKDMRCYVHRYRKFYSFTTKKSVFLFQDIMYFLAEWRTPATHFYSQFSPPGIYINPTSSQTTPNMAKYESNPKR